jgi:hypothetical protein
MRFGISGNQCIIDTSSHVEILNGKEIIQNVFQVFFSIWLIKGGCYHRTNLKIRPYGENVKNVILLL